MNTIGTFRIQLPPRFSGQSDYICDRVREGIGQRRYRGETLIEHLSLGVIETNPLTTADDLVSEILSRIDRQLEPWR